jgi:hypothetical protein
MLLMILLQRENAVALQGLVGDPSQVCCQGYVSILLAKQRYYVLML